MDLNKRSKLSVYFGRFCEAAGLTALSCRDLRASYCTAIDKVSLLIEHIEHISMAVAHDGNDVWRKYIRPGI